METFRNVKHAEASDLESWRTAGEAAGQVIARALCEQLQDSSMRERDFMQRLEPLLTLLKNVPTPATNAPDSKLRDLEPTPQPPLVPVYVKEEPCKSAPEAEQCSDSDDDDLSSTDSESTSVGNEYEPPSPMFPTVNTMTPVNQPSFPVGPVNIARVDERSATLATESWTNLPSVELKPALPNRKRPRF